MTNNSNPVAIDVGPLTSGDAVRGIGVYARELLAGLHIDGVDVFNENLSKYKVVHLTRFNPFFLSIPINKPRGVKFILTIYDLIPLIYPNHYKPGLRGSFVWFVNRVLIKRYVDAIITISETSKKDICRFLKVDPSIVHVTYLAPRKIFNKIMPTESQKRSLVRKYNLPKKYALYVGDVNFNKNLPLLVEACRTAKIPLVISGKQAAEIKNANIEHAELKHLESINWNNCYTIGFTSDSDLNLIYNLADVYVQPSLYEGFGLPVIEAMAAGCPVVCSKTQALVEITRGAALYADPKSVSDLSSKIRLVIENSAKRQSLIKQGLLVSKEYSWAKTALETTKIYDKV